MDSKTINTYNQMAKEYDDETIDFWDKFPRTFLDRFIELANGEKVLDIGSGPGRDGILLKLGGIDVVCLDASESMVKLCLDRGLEAVLGDFNELPFEDNFFGGVWAYTSLLHVKKAEVKKSIDEIKRVMPIGGILGLGMIEGETEEYRESSIINKLRWFSFYQKSELEDLLKQNGFETIYYEEFKPRSKNYLNFIAKLISK